MRTIEEIVKGQGLWSWGDQRSESQPSSVSEATSEKALLSAQQIDNLCGPAIPDPSCVGFIE